MEMSYDGKLLYNNILIRRFTAGLRNPAGINWNATTNKENDMRPFPKMKTQKCKVEFVFGRPNLILDARFRITDDTGIVHTINPGSDAERFATACGLDLTCDDLGSQIEAITQYPIDFQFIQK